MLTFMSRCCSIRNYGYSRFEHRYEALQVISGLHPVIHTYNTESGWVMTLVVIIQPLSVLYV